MLVGKNGRFKLLEASETSAFARKHVQNIRILPTSTSKTSALAHKRVQGL
jgi:hypothetical protein